MENKEKTYLVTVGHDILKLSLSEHAVEINLEVGKQNRLHMINIEKSNFTD